MTMTQDPSIRLQSSPDRLAARGPRRSGAGMALLSKAAYGAGTRAGRVLCVALLALATGAGAAELPDMTIPNTLGMQVKNENMDDKDFDLLIASGVKVIRRGFHWQTFEREKGVYTFTENDRFMDWARKNGIRVVGTFFAQKKDLYEPTAPKPGRAIQTEAGREGFANFAAACAAHYKGRDVYWEIWSEPNTQTFWRKGTHNSEEFADEYAKLVNAVMPKMLAADPDCIVMAGSVSNYWAPVYKWTEECFKRGVLQSGIRLWSVHPYGVTHPEDHVAGGGGGHVKMKALIAQYAPGKDIPLAISERGFALGKTTGGSQENEGWSGGEQARVHEFQAWHFVRQYLVDLMTNTRITIWYEWRSKEHNSGFGFLNDDGTPRPVYHACVNLVKQLGGYKFTDRVQTESDMDFVLRFANAEGATKLVAWTRPPEKAKPDGYQKHEIRLALEGGSYVVSDVLNKQTSTIATVDGKLPITLTGGPLYIGRVR